MAKRPRVLSASSVPATATAPPARRVPPDLAQLGQTGLVRFSGRVYDEWLPDLQGAQGRRVYRQMMDNDAIIGAVIFGIEMLLRQVTWTVVPGGDDAEALAQARFVTECLGDMRYTWGETLSEILSFLGYGFSVHELVYKVRRGGDAPRVGGSKYADGKTGWDAWAIRGQETLLRWDFDDNSQATAYHQLGPPDYIEHTIPLGKALLFRTTSRRNNPEGRSILRNSYRCYAQDTDILTREGWKNGFDVTLDDDVATLNPQTGCLEYHHPTDVHRYDHDGQMLHVQGKALDLLVTPNHRLWVRRTGKSDFEFIEALDVRPSVFYQRYATWSGQSVPVHAIPPFEVHQTFRGGHAGVRETLPEVRVPMDDWLAFLGIFLADGNTYRRTDGNRQAEVTITQKEGEKADKIRALLERLPWHVCERSDGRGMLRFTISSVQLWDHLAPLGKAYTKYVPSYVKDLPPESIATFLAWYHLGDGSVAGNLAGGYEGTRLYFTVSAIMADDLSELILKAGWCPHIGVQRSPGYGSGVIYKVTQGKPLDTCAGSYTWEDYSGPIWCVTVPHNIVYVRRDGKSAWSGNSWFYKTKIETIEGIGIERDLVGLPVVHVPHEYLMDDATPEMVTALQTMAQMVTNIRRDEQEGIVMPTAFDEANNPLFTLELLSSGGARQFDTSAIITRYEQRMAMTALADFVLLGHESVGSNALSQDKTGMFVVALDAWAQLISDQADNHAIPDLLRYNGYDLSKAPTLSHSPIDGANLGVLGTYLLQIAEAGIQFDVSPEGALSRRLLQQAGLPMPPLPLAGSPPAPPLYQKDLPPKSGGQGAPVTTPGKRAEPSTKGNPPQKGGGGQRG